LSLALSATLYAFSLSMPGRRSFWTSLLPMATLFSWVAWILSTAATERRLELGSGLACAFDILGLSLIPGALLFFVLSRCAPLRSRTIGCYAAAGVAALSCLATGFLCRNENPLHTFAWHFLPVLAAGVVGTAIGRVCFKGFDFPGRMNARER
jgi:hypothetical protein